MDYRLFIIIYYYLLLIISSTFQEIRINLIKFCLNNICNRVNLNCNLIFILICNINFILMQT